MTANVSDLTSETYNLRFSFMRFVQKYVQDMSNSTRADTRTCTRPEYASIKGKKLQFIFI